MQKQCYVVLSKITKFVEIQRTLTLVLNIISLTQSLYIEDRGIVFREPVAVYSKSQSKPMNILSGRHSE
jgi:hypothetical protein